MELQRIRETVFEHEEGKDTATITAAERWSITRMRKLAEEYPEQVSIYENKDGSLFCHVPWKWMKLTPPRVMSEAQKAVLDEARKKIRR